MIMVVRVRIRVKVSRVAKTVALACSGYEAKAPQVMIPAKFAEELGCWPSKRAIEAEFDMAEGPLKI